MKNNLCIIAAHTTSNLQLDCVCSNLKYFQEISDKIVIVNSKEFRTNDKLKEEIDKKYPDIDIEYQYCANLVNLCHGKWLYYLDNFYYGDYENLILTNDSFLVINTLKPLVNLHLSENYEMTGLVSSREGKWHCQDFIRLYSNASINKIINFYKENNIKYGHYKLVEEVDNKRKNAHYGYCIEAERESCQLFSKQACLYTLPLSYKKNINFDNDKLKEYIEEKSYPIVKIRKLNFTTYTKDYSNNLPEDFDHAEYKSINTDLPFHSKEKLEEHFKQYGHKEGRLYKPNQSVILPEYIQKKVKKEIGYV